MMEFPLTLAAVFRRAEQVFPRGTVATRRADKSIHRYTYGDFANRSRRLASALRALGVKPGDRVATLAWNNYQHLEAYFGIPLAGGVLHTLNLRLHPDELAFIVNDADDRAVIVDHTLLPLWEKVAPQTNVAHVIVFGADPGPADRVRQGYGGQDASHHDYEMLIAGAEPLGDESDPDERTAAAMCYT